MAYWGTDAPVIQYAVGGYTVSWDLSTCPVVQLEYSWLPDRINNESVLTGHVNITDIGGGGYGRFTAKIGVPNLTAAQMATVRTLSSKILVTLRLHKTPPYTGDYFDVPCWVKKIQPFAETETGVPYPQYDSVYIELESVDYVTLPEVSP